MNPIILEIADLALTVQVQNGSEWSTHRTDIAIATMQLEPGAFNDAVVALLDEAGVSAADAVLRIPASWCYLHRLDVPRRRPSRETLHYALEEYVPVDLETLVCDFWALDEGGWLGVATDVARLVAYVDALQPRLAIQSIQVQFGPALGDGTTLWCDVRHCVLTKWQHGKPSSVRVVHLADDTSSADWTNRITEVLRTAGVSSAVQLGGTVPAASMELLVFEGAVAAPAASAPIEPAIGVDLARDSLTPATRAQRRWLAMRRLSLVATVACLLATAGSLWEQHGLAARLEQVTNWERGVYSKVLPGKSIPGSIALQLASERNRLEALEQAPELNGTQSDALGLLQRICAAIPVDQRYQFDEIRIDGHDLVLHGATRDHAHAEQLAANLGRAASSRPESPRTERRADGNVTFFVHALVQPADSRKTEGHR